MTSTKLTKRNGLRYSASALALTLAVGFAGEASAQIDEIIVTALKREQSLQDVPSSVAAISGEKLDVLASGGGDIRFLRARIPSLNIESSFGRTFPRFYIRGLGNSDFDLNASQPVSLVYDGVVLENPILKGFPVFDVDRIEVLRGPQGTLFGRNTPAGIVKFESVRPSHDFGGYASLGGGRFGFIDFEGAVGGSLVEDKLAGRVSIQYQRQNDYVDNTFAAGDEADFEGFDEFAGRVQLLYTPNENFSALLNVHGRRLDGTARLFRANVIDSGTTGLNSNFDRFSVSQDGTNFQKLQSLGANATIDYDFGSHTLTAIVGYEGGEIDTQGDIDGGYGANLLSIPNDPSQFGPGNIPFDAQTQDNIDQLDQTTVEVRLASNELGRLDYQIGAFFFAEEIAISSFNFEETSFPGFSLAPGASFVDGIALQEQDANTFAFFGSIDYDITDDLKFNGGVRWSRDSKDFTASRPLAPLGFSGQLPTTAPITESTDDSVVSWDASLTYAVNDDLNIYARAARGFRAPSIQGRVLFAFGQGGVTVADTETILSFEAGFKSEFWEDRARINLTGYYFDVSDQQLTAVGGGSNTASLLNVEEVIGYGFELDGEFNPFENMFITAGTSFNFTEINDPNASTEVGGSGPLFLDPQVGVSAAGNPIVSIDGNNLPQAPRWIANVTMRYGIPAPNMGGEFYVFTDWAYRSEVSFFLYESAEFQDKRLLEGGVRVGYVNEEHGYELAAFGRNITNDESLTGGIDFNNLTGFVNEPRIWGFEGILRF